MAASTASASSTRPERGIMDKRIKTTEPTVKRIQTSEPTVRRLDPQTVAEALGGEPVSGHVEGRPGPLTLHVLREELLRRRQSSGGRPGLEGTNLRAKVPLNNQDWSRLEELAASLSTVGFAPSAGQVASVLLSIALRSLAQDQQSQEHTSQEYAALIARELVAQQAEKDR